MRPFRWIGGKYVRGRAMLGTAVRGVIVNRMRAFLSSLGIAIGVATLMAIASLVQGLQQSFTQQIAALGANTIYISNRPWIIRGEWWKYRNRPPITMDDVTALQRDASLLTAVAPVTFTMADVSYLSERIGMVQVRGTTDEFLETSAMIVEYGRFLTPIEVELNDNVVVIGSEVKSRLFKGMDPIGQRIVVGNMRFRIVGILQEQGKMFGQSLDNIVFIPIHRFREQFGFKRGMSIAVSTPPEHINAAQDQIIEVLRRSRGLSAAEEETFAINQQSELVKVFESETRALFGAAMAVGLITLLVGGIGVMKTMLVAVTERTREIGVRRALGARHGTILAQFLTESMMVTVIGGAFGTAIGMAGAKFLSVVTPLPAAATAEVAIIGIIFSGVVGLLFGTWPAYRAATLDPIESLRYE